MADFLAHNPALVLFATMLLGHILGKVRFAGVQLGSAAVLFAGLFFGSLWPEAKIHDGVIYVGLVLFVYCLGLYSGETFTRSFRGNGKWLQAASFGMVILLFGAVLLANLVLGFEPAAISGAFAGVLTTTPALAGLLKVIGKVSDEAAQDQAIAFFSIAYPFGLVGVVAGVILWEKIFRISPEKTPEIWFGASRGDSNKVVRRVVDIAHQMIEAPSVQDLVKEHGLSVRFGRIRRENDLFLATGSTVLENGLAVSLTGSKSEVERAIEILGRASERQIASHDEHTGTADFYVSQPSAVDIPLRELDIEHDHHASIFKIRRGDFEFAPSGSSTLELGDVVRVAFPIDQLSAMQRIFGNSYKAGGDFDLLGLSLGIVVGILIGLVPMPLPGGAQIQLGNAGGPLVVGLILGNLKRTGSIVWRLAPNANATLRQLGLLLFLGGVGLKAGGAFLPALLSSSGLGVVILTLGVSVTSSMIMLWIFHRLFKTPFAASVGMLAGFQTSPALLSFAQNHCHDDSVTARFAVFYPLATCIKIFLAQLFFLMMIN